MRLGMVIVLAIMILMAVTADAQEDVVRKEVEKLQGKWVRIYMEADGKKFVDGKKQPGKAVTLTIKGGKYEGENFQLDPLKTPKQINVSTADDKGKAISLPGIYELKDDVLKLCFPFPFEGKFDKVGKRPTEFGSMPGGNDVLEVYKREKR